MEFKDIVKEWQGQFPILSPYTPTTLFAKADIVLIGLRLDKVLSERWYDEIKCDRYRVTLQILPLWVEKDKIHIPFDEEELWDDTGLQILLEYKLHDPLLKDFVDGQKKWGVTDTDGSKFRREKDRRLGILEKAFECAHQRFGDVLKENVELRDLFRMIGSPCVLDHWFMSHIPELKLSLAYYFGDEKLIANVKKEIDDESKHWDNEAFKRFTNMSIEEWKEDLYHRMENREAFMNQVERNLSLRKISGLKTIHIHDDGKWNESDNITDNVDMNQSSRIQDDEEAEMSLLQRILRFLRRHVAPQN